MERTTNHIMTIVGVQADQTVDLERTAVKRRNVRKVLLIATFLGYSMFPMEKGKVTVPRNEERGARARVAQHGADQLQTGTNAEQSWIRQTEAWRRC